jgi:hypothetical protein
MALTAQRVRATPSLAWPKTLDSVSSSQPPGQYTCPKSSSRMRAHQRDHSHTWQPWPYQGHVHGKLKMLTMTYYATGMHPTVEPMTVRLGWGEGTHQGQNQGQHQSWGTACMHACMPHDVNRGRSNGSHVHSSCSTHREEVTCLCTQMTLREMCGGEAATAAKRCPHGTLLVGSSAPTHAYATIRDPCRSCTQHCRRPGTAHSLMEAARVRPNVALASFDTGSGPR